MKDGYSITDSFLYLMASWDHNINQYCIIVTCRAGSEKIPRFQLDIMPFNNDALLKSFGFYQLS